MANTNNRPGGPPPNPERSLRLEDMRKRAEDRQLLMTTAPLHDIRIIDDKTIEWDGLKLSLEHRAFADLMKALGLTREAGSNLTTIGAAEQREGTKLLNLVKKALTSVSKSASVVIAADRDRNVHRIYSSKTVPTILAAGYFSALERYMETDDFVIDSYSVNAGGRISTNLRVPGIELNVGGLPDEWFTPGVNMSLSDKGITVTPFTFRWICTNGAEFGSIPNPALPLSRFTLGSTKEMAEWFKDLARLQAAKYTDPSYAVRVLKARETPASYAELVRVDDQIRKAIGKQEATSTPVTRFSDLAVSENAYKAKDIHFDTMTTEQKQHLRADRTVWEAVNQVTDFASHDYGFNVGESTRTDLRRFAGRLLMQHFDCEHEVMRQAF